MNYKEINWHNAVLACNKNTKKIIFLNIIAPVYLNVSQRHISSTDYDFFRLCHIDASFRHNTKDINLLDTMILNNELVNYLKKKYKFIDVNDCVSYNDVLLLQEF